MKTALAFAVFCFLGVFWSGVDSTMCCWIAWVVQPSDDDDNSTIPFVQT